MRSALRIVVTAGVSAALGAASGPAFAKVVDADPSNYTAMLATLQPGDTLQLAAGTYAPTGSTPLPLANLNGTASAWITVTGPAADPPTAVFQASPDGCCNVVDITSSSFLAIENLYVDGNHVDSAFGISAGGGTGNLVHDIRVEGCTLVDMDNDGVTGDMGQQDDGISTKTPTWGWVIRRNTIVGAGTGMYLGNSDGSDPFIDGVIDDNLIEAPTGYCIEIKQQNPWPTVAGIPTQPTTTVISNNVFVKTDHPPTMSGPRPELLVDGFPASGPGAQNMYAIYGNLFDHDADNPLLQVSGRVSVHDNVFVDAPGQSGIALQDHDLPLELAYVYDNTFYSMPQGIVFASSAPEGDLVEGNLVLTGTAMGTQITGPITNLMDNVTDVQANAATYVASPSTTLGQMDFYPLPGECTGAALDTSKLTSDPEYDVDFNCTSRGSFTYRGAYAGSGKNPGWALAQAVKVEGTCGSTDAGIPVVDGGAGSDAGASADSGTAGRSDAGDAGAGAADAGQPPSASSGSSHGCGCSTPGSGPVERATPLVLAAAAILGARARRKRRSA